MSEIKIKYTEWTPSPFFMKDGKGSRTLGFGVDRHPRWFTLIIFLWFFRAGISWKREVESITGAFARFGEPDRNGDIVCAEGIEDKHGEVPLFRNGKEIGSASYIVEGDQLSVTANINENHP